MMTSRHADSRANAKCNLLTFHCYLSNALAYVRSSCISGHDMCLVGGCSVNGSHDNMSASLQVRVGYSEHRNWYPELAGYNHPLP